MQINVLKDAKEVLEQLESKYNILGIVKKSVTIKDGIYEGLPLVINPKNKIAEEIKEEYVKIFNYIENIRGKQYE